MPPSGLFHKVERVQRLSASGPWVELGALGMTEMVRLGASAIALSPCLMESQFGRQKSSAGLRLGRRVAAHLHLVLAVGAASRWCCKLLYAVGLTLSGEGVALLPVYRHLISTKQLGREWIDSELLPACDELRRDRNGSSEALDGQALYCLFYEPSFLTRTSFERAMGLLGGQAYHTEDASQFFPVRSASHIDNTIRILDSLHMDGVVLRSSDPGIVDRAAAADAVPVINGGSLDDHPTQALADICTLHRELGGVDGTRIAILGRLEHRNVNALLLGLALYEDVRVTLIPFSGQVDPQVAAYCVDRDVELSIARGIEPVEEVDAIYLNAPKTVAHAQLLRARGALEVRIDEEFMARLKSHCVILDPMQRSGDFDIEVQDERLAFYRQAENALFVRMALLSDMLGTG